MAIDLSKLAQEVQNNRDVTNGVVTVLQALRAQIEAIPESKDPETQSQLDALVEQLGQQDTAIAQAVAANTKAAS